MFRLKSEKLRKIFKKKRKKELNIYKSTLLIKASQIKNKAPP